MSEIVPTLYDGTGHYEQSTTLDGSVFIFIFDFNSRDECWYLSLNDVENVPIKGAQSRRLVPNWPPLRRCVDPRRPLGELLVVSPDGSIPGLYDLGSTSWLHYFTADDMAEIKAAL